MSKFFKTALVSLISVFMLGANGAWAMSQHPDAAAQNQAALNTQNEIVVYSARNESLIKPVFELFTQETGIRVKTLTGKEEALIERLKSEGASTPADILLTVDAGNLWYAAQQGVFQPYMTAQMKANIPSHLRDPQDLWTGLSLRARTIVYSTERVKPSELSTYEDLASPKWKDRLCVRSSKKVYNKSLVSAMLAHQGESETRRIVQGWVNNLALQPHAKDTQVIEAILAGQCDVGIINTYYFGGMQAKNPEMKAKLFWANQATTGTHVNVSGAGLLQHAKHPVEAKKLLEWLTERGAQGIFASVNKEYPANPKVGLDKMVQGWGPFKQDRLNMAVIGEGQEAAVKLMQTVGYR